MYFGRGGRSPQGNPQGNSLALWEVGGFASLELLKNLPFYLESWKIPRNLKS